jgi:hypothetical protein
VKTLRLGFIEDELRNKQVVIPVPVVLLKRQGMETFAPIKGKVYLRSGHGGLEGSRCITLFV